MALNLPQATVIGYSSRGDFFGSDVARWRIVQTVTVEGIMDSTEIAGAGNMVADGSDDPTSANTFLGHSITVNGVNNPVNNSKLISLNFPASEGSITEKHISLAKYVATFEIYIAPSDLPGNDADANTILGIAFNDIRSLSEFSEDISFDKGEDNTRSTTHTLNIKYETGTGGGATDAGANAELSGITAAKTLATTIFADTNSWASTVMFDYMYSDVIGTSYPSNTQSYFTEVYDTHNSTCSFTKRYRLTSSPDSSGDWTIRITNKLSYDDSGMVSITENGEIEGKNKSAPTVIALDGVEAEVGPLHGESSAWTRCNSLYSYFRTSGDDGQGRPWHSAQQLIGSGDLGKIAIEYTTGQNRSANKASYSITFTNDSFVDGANKYKFQSTITEGVSASSAEMSQSSYSEEGIITSLYESDYQVLDYDPSDGTAPHDDGGTSFEMTDVLVDKVAGSATRVLSAMNSATGQGLVAADLKRVSKKINYSPLGKEASFTLNFENDPRYFPEDTTNINKLERGFTTSPGVLKKDWINVPNNPYLGEFFHMDDRKQIKNGKIFQENGNEESFGVGGIVQDVSTRKVVYKGVIGRNKTISGLHGWYTAADYHSVVLSTLKDFNLDIKIAAVGVYTEYLVPIASGAFRYYLEKFYFSGVSWNFGSNYDFELSLEMNYALPTHYSGIDIMSDHRAITV